MNRVTIIFFVVIISRYEWGTWVDNDLLDALRGSLDGLAFAPPSPAAREACFAALRAAGAATAIRKAAAASDGVDEEFPPAASASDGAACAELGRGRDWRATLHLFEGAGARQHTTEFPGAVHLAKVRFDSTTVSERPSV